MNTLYLILQKGSTRSIVLKVERTGIIYESSTEPVLMDNILLESLASQDLVII